MLFSIDEDTGVRVIGWVMPDHPSTKPRIRVSFYGEQKHVVEAQIYRPLLKEQGLHNTGICGFVLDENTCVGISTAKVLELYDETNNTLIYQRRPERPLLESKLLRLETQLLRLAELDNQLAPQFHMPYVSLEIIPEETTNSIFGISFTGSIYASGRIYYKAYEPLLRDRGFKIAVMLRDPLEELAERLLVLKVAKSPEGAGVLKSLGRAFTTLVHMIQSDAFTDLKNVERTVSSLDEESKSLLFNTLARQLSNKSGLDPLDPMAVAMALDALSEFDLVGIRSDPNSLTDALSAVLGADEPLERVTFKDFRKVKEFAEMLRGSPLMAEMISMDIEIYAAATEAINSVKQNVA